MFLKHLHGFMWKVEIGKEAWLEKIAILAKKDVHTEYVESDKVDFERTEQLLVSGARRCDEQKGTIHKTLTRKGRRESKADN